MRRSPGVCGENWTLVNSRFSLSSAKETNAATVAGNMLFASCRSARSGRRRAAALVEPMDKRSELDGAERRSLAEAAPLIWGADPTRKREGSDGRDRAGASGASDRGRGRGRSDPTDPESGRDTGPTGPQRERCGAHSGVDRSDRAGRGPACELLGCGHALSVYVRHPQRGRLGVCWYHALRVQEIGGHPVERVSA